MENIQKVVIPGQGQTSDFNGILRQISDDLRNMNFLRVNDFMPVRACIFKRKKVVGYQETFIRISFIKEMFEKQIGGSMYIHLLMYDGTCIFLNNMSLGEFFGEINDFARVY